ncbi:MAG: OadG family protein [Clostridia bacterium]|nr:OadG family protein [Clostridia bacterium]
MSYPELLGNSLIGFCLVFAVLVLLMVFVLIINAVFKDRKPKAEPAVAPAQNAKPEIPEVILENVSEPDAAMIMAIVADESGIPVEKLRFISIREVE